MKDKYFIDTNIFVYTFSPETPEKYKKSNKLIKRALLEHNGFVSFQVIQELINVSTRKFEAPIEIGYCQKYLDKVLSPLCEVFASIELYQHTLDIMQRWQYSFYDSLIIAAALQSDCEILYSEDLQHNQKIQSLVIVNPFL